MYIGRDFAPFENQSARILGFDLANLFADGETISSITSRLRIAVPADDPLPATHLPVSPQFSGALVNQMVSFNDPADMLLGNTYALSFAVTTNLRLMTPWARFTLIQGYGISSYAGGAPPASAASLILPAPDLQYTLPTMLGGYAGVDFPVANQSEALIYSFDFSAALSAGETIDSASSYLGVWSGADTVVLNDPNAYDTGPMLISGAVVRRKLTWPAGSALTANVYVLQLTAVTSNNQSLAAKARIVVGRVG